MGPHGLIQTARLPRPKPLLVQESFTLSSVQEGISRFQHLLRVHSGVRQAALGWKSHLGIGITAWPPFDISNAVEPRAGRRLKQHSRPGSSPPQRRYIDNSTWHMSWTTWPLPGSYLEDPTWIATWKHIDPHRARAAREKRHRWLVTSVAAASILTSQGDTWWAYIQQEPHRGRLLTCDCHDSLTTVKFAHLRLSLTCDCYLQLSCVRWGGVGGAGQ